MKLVGMSLLASLVSSGDITDFVTAGINPEMFKPTELEVYEFIVEHVKNYGVVPAIDTVFEETGTELPDAPEPPEFYLDQVKERWLTKKISLALKEANQALTDMRPYDALTHLSSEVIAMIHPEHKDKLLDFRDSADQIHSEYQKQKKGPELHAVMTGWPYLDDMMAGAHGGDVISIVGRPATGKTFKLLRCAHWPWLNQHRIPLIISMEMKPFLLQQRIAAMHVRKNLTQLKTGQFSTKTYKGVINELRALQEFDVPFWIVDGNMTATVEDIWLLARQLKPDCLYIDGAYLLKHPQQNIKKWEKISKTAEEVKFMAGDLNIPVFNSYQFNRDAVKKKKDEDPGLENIAGADDIGQLSSIVLGLLEHDTVETINRRRVSILKGRGGEIGEFDINWDFQFMNFDQYIEEKLKDMQFI